MFSRGRLREREFYAAARLRDLHEAAKDLRCSAQSERVDGGRGASATAEAHVHQRADSQRQYREAIKALPWPCSEVVLNFVIDDGNCVSAGALKSLNQPWAQKAGSKERGMVAQAFLGMGLSLLAAHFTNQGDADVRD